MALYHFVTTVEVAAEREAAWEVIDDPTGWPAWWRWLHEVDLLDEGREDGQGRRYRYAFRTALPYTLSFESEVVRREPPALLDARATGELAGVGLWELSEEEGVTEVRHTWIVETTKRWMNLLAPVARPAFSWNHDVLMKNFAEGFAGRLDARLISVDNRTVAPGSPGFGEVPPAAAG